MLFFADVRPLIRNLTMLVSVFAASQQVVAMGQQAGSSVDKTNRSIQDRGDFQVVYTPTEHFAEMERILKDSKLFEETVDELNKAVALPTNLQINFTECGEANAFYDPQTHQLRMCYEVIESAAQQLSSLDLDDDELDQAVTNVTFFIFFHELGHALVHLLELPITGKEEDAVDQPAITTLLEDDEDEAGGEAALHAAVWFLASMQDTDIEQWPFWDEHSLDIQRFYNILCWVYGKDPEQYTELIQEGCLPNGDTCLPQERAEGCQAEYQQMSKSWDQLLVPYLKE